MNLSYWRCTLLIPASNWGCVILCI